MQTLTIELMRQVAALKSKPESRSGERGDSTDIVEEIKKYLKNKGRQYSLKKQSDFDYYEITDGGCLTGDHGGTGYGFQVFSSGAAIYHCHHNTCAGVTGQSAWDVIGLEKKKKSKTKSKDAPKAYKLPEIMVQLEELRTVQATFWLKKATDPSAEEPPIAAMTRAIVSKCGALGELEIHTVIDEIERHPPLLKNARTSILKMWNASKRQLKRAIKPKATDDMIADAFKAKHENRRMYTRARWYKWDDCGVWSDQCDTTDEIWDQMIAMKDLDVTPSKHKRASIEERLQGHSMMGVPESAVDAHPEWINLTNGVLDIATGEMRPASYDLYLTTQLPFDYSQNAECPRWLDFLNQVLIDRDGQPCETMIHFMRQAFGYSLTAWTKYEISFWLQGDGANGKSTLLRVLSEMSGTASMSLNLGMLERDTYQLANLPGVRVVLCSESPVGLKVADSILKGLISGDRTSVRAPYKESFQLTPECKIWWAMNNPPKVADTSEGFWRRVKVVPFRACFGRNGQAADVNLKDKLISELPGILNWSLGGLRDLEESGWAQSPEIEDATAAYRESNDVERAFIDDMCIEGADYKVSGKQLYEAYKQWCSETGHRYKSMTRVASDWVRIGFRKKRAGSGVWYHGVGLLTQELPPI
jgi:P4 family phage/plasmid primase-like protien